MLQAASCNKHSGLKSHIGLEKFPLASIQLNISTNHVEMNEHKTFS